MTLNKTTHWVGLAVAAMASSAHAATINCTVTPANSVITQGQSLQLAATCDGGALSSIEWLRDGASITKPVNLSGDTSAPIHYTAPVEESEGDFVYEVAGVPANGSDTVVSSKARVVVKPSTWTSSGALLTTKAASTAAAVNASCAVSSSTSVTSLPAQLCNPGKPALVITGPTYFSWSCLGLNGGSDANCYALNSASPPPPPPPDPVLVNGSCGIANGSSYTSAPTGTSLCSSGTASTVSIATSSYSWNCAGANGGTNAFCSATKTTTTLPPPPGGTGTPSSVDTGYESGLWVPSTMPKRTVADQSSAQMIGSYVPGCLNGLYAKDSSSACAGLDSFTGTTADTGAARTVKLGSGNELVLRYMTGATVTNNKRIKVLAWNGGSVGVNMRTWLSTDPLATYDSAPANCKAAGAVTPQITTGAQESVTTTTTAWGKTTTTTAYYCKVDPNKVYYFGIAFDEAVSGLSGRFQVDESGSDFLP